jgi:hypothetical protein
MPPKSVKSTKSTKTIKSKSEESEEVPIKVEKVEVDEEVEDVKPKKTQEKVVKKTPPKKVTKKEESESEQSESEQSESEQSESEHSESEHEVVVEKKEEKTQDWNAQLSDDDKPNVGPDVETKPFQKHSKHNLDRPQYKSKRFNNNAQNNSQNNSQKDRNFNNKFERKPNINKLSKALKFSYNDYDHVANPVHEVSSEDLLRVVVARSYKEGQMSLKRCLETVLRAMNHECNFPSLPKHNNFTKSENLEKTNE